MDPRYDPHAGQGRLAGPWAPQPGPPGPAGGDDGTDDTLVRLGGFLLVALATALVATVALLAAGIAYLIATWRRWRWWPPALAGAAGLLVVVAVSGPDRALDRHLLPLHELTAATRPPVGSLVAGRWPAWALAQLPFSIPFGLLLAGLARHQVTRVAAHELSPRARARREAEDRAQLRTATRRSATAPVEVGGHPVLGAWAGGDLDAWRAGQWCVVPENTLGLGTLLVGLPGAGKTETLLRLAQLAMHRGYDVHVVDAKGDPDTQTRFAALAEAMGVEARLFPAEPYDGFRGDTEALRNRLARIVDYTEPYYQDGARVLISAACGTSPPRSFAEFLGRLEERGVADASVRKGTLARYTSFAAAVGERLNRGWAFEDTRASYLLLDGLALGDDTPRLARYLLEDFTHYCTSRKPPDRRALLLVDEFSALRLGNAAALFERLRSFQAGVVLAAQSVEGLHDDPSERDRLLNSASTIVAHRLADPDPVVTRAGTVRRAERSHQLDTTGATGLGSLRIQDAYRVDPNDLRSLPPGVAWVVTGGRAAKIAVARARGEQGSGPGSPQHGGWGNDAAGPGSPALVRVGEAPTVGNMTEMVESAILNSHPDDETLTDAEHQAGAAGEGSVVPSPEPDEPQQPAAEDPPRGPARSPYAEGL